LLSDQIHIFFGDSPKETWVIYMVFLYDQRLVVEADFSLCFLFTSLSFFVAPCLHTFPSPLRSSWPPRGVLGLSAAPARRGERPPVHDGLHPPRGLLRQRPGPSPPSLPWGRPSVLEPQYVIF